MNTPDTASLLHRIAELTLAGSGADAVHLERVDLQRGEVEVVVTAGAAVSALGARVPLAGSLAADVLGRKEPQLLDPGGLQRHRIAGLLPGADRGCSALVLPLIAEEQGLGILVLFRTAGSTPFAPGDVSGVRVLGDMAALALRPVLARPRSSPSAAVVDPHEQRFHLLVESIQDYGIFMLDPEGRITTWNTGAERIKGYTADQILGKHVSTFYTEDDRARRHPDHELRLAARDGSYQEEGWRVRRDGSCYWAHATISAMRDANGHLIGFAGVTRDLTERRKAAEALRDSEERFRQLAENAREVFWLFTSGLEQALYVSPAYERVWGRPIETLFRDPGSWLEAVHPEDRERALACAEELQERETSVELRVVHPDGSVRWLWVRGFPIRNEKGEVIRLGGVTEDITDEKAAEWRLRFLAEAGRVLGTSLDYHETLRNVARLAVPSTADWCMVDVLEDGRLQRLGVAHTDPEKEALAWEIARRYPPDPSAGAGVAQALRSGEPIVWPELSDEILRRVALDEEHFRLLSELGLRSSMILPMIARGRTLGAISFVAAESGRSFGPEDLPFAQEIAARAALAVDNARLYTQATEARGEAERRAREEAALRRAAEAVTATFTIEDVIQQVAANSLRATSADGAFVKRIHSDGHEVEVVAAVGQKVPPLGARTPYHGSYTQLVMESGEPVLVPSLVAATQAVSDGIMDQCGECSAMVIPLIDAGEAIGTLVLTRDLERHGFRIDEMERARAFGDLASLAFRKIHLLQESEQRREDLELVMESRARLIRGFSHDVKNPLGAADGYLALIEDGIVTEPGKLEFSIGRARRAIRSALDLIQDLSELARAEAGHVEVDLAAVDVREVAREMEEEYRAQAEAKGLEIGYECPDEFPMVVSDANRIRQILGNLLSNAVKYTVQGSIGVRVTAGSGGQAPAPGPWVSIDVVDTGPGIPPEKLHLLFREFTRLEPGKTPGAGLGLAISQRIAEALSGRITVQSQPGSGSVFTLWLPLERHPEKNGS